MWIEGITDDEMALAACMSTPKAVSLGKGFAGKQLQSVTTRMAKLAVAPVAQPLLVEAGQKGGKLKTCKAAAKRFRITGTGKVRRGLHMPLWSRSAEWGMRECGTAGGPTWGLHGAAGVGM